MGVDMGMEITLPKEVSEEEFGKYFILTNTEDLYRPTKEFLSRTIGEDYDDSWNGYLIWVKNEKCFDGGKFIHKRYILNDSCKLGSGCLILSPSSLSELFPGARIECVTDFDGCDRTMTAYVNGECVESKSLPDAWLTSEELSKLKQETKADGKTKTADTVRTFDF